MISFRYHLVSLVAVFFAMAIGVIVGTTVINDQLIRNLQTQRNHDRTELQAERTKTGIFQAELGVWERVAKATYEPAMRDKLAGKPVVLLVANGETEKIAPAVADALDTAGATLAGRIEFTETFDPEGVDPTELVEALGAGARDLKGDALVERAATMLAARLRAPAEERGSDLLDVLDQAGLIKFTQQSDGVFPPRGSSFLYVVNGGGAVRPRNDVFGLPLVKALSASSVVAVTEPLGAEQSLTERVTADESMRARVVTVDHADTSPGLYSLVVGLADLIAGDPAEHYGIRRRASGVLPSP